MSTTDEALTEQIARKLDPSSWRLHDSGTFPPEHQASQAVIRQSMDDAATVLPIIRKAECDAAREALKRLRRQELAIIPTDADPDDTICVRQQALAWRIDCLIRNDYPEDVTP